jgi:hypothetical protein
MILVAAMRWWGAVRPISCWPAARNAAPVSDADNACCWILTRANRFSALGRRWTGRISYIASGARDRLGPSAVLVRPDGIVARAADAAPDHEEAARAAARWSGAHS